MRIFLFFCLGFVLSSCDQGTFVKKGKRLKHLTPYSEAGNLQMVVSIPAGTVQAYEYNEQKHRLVQADEADPHQVLDFLPYPGNFGFIPSGDPEVQSDALDVLLLSKPLSRSTIVEIIPIATLLLKAGANKMTKIIAVPRDSSLRVIDATNFATFLIKYDAAKRIIEEWFTHYRGDRGVISLGWKNEAYALDMIKKKKAD